MNTQSGPMFGRILGRNQNGFSIVEAMISIVILAIGLLGASYVLHVSHRVERDNMSILHRSTDVKDEAGLRDKFNEQQVNVYGALR